MLRFVGALFIVAGAMPAVAQTAPSSGAVYKLDEGSTFQRGCFPPCECPLPAKEPVHGTFVLTPAGVDPLFEHYDVSRVNWQIVKPSGPVLPVVGSGTFKIGGEFALQEQLLVDLELGSEPAQRFDSGLVAPGVVFPRLDLTVSIHGMYCLDTVFHVIASPQPRLTIDRDGILWDTDPSATNYDVVRGDLLLLRGTNGDYRVATVACVASRVFAPPVSYAESPAPGGAFWFLVRDTDGSYDAWDAPLAGPRDAGINASPASCP